MNRVVGLLLLIAVTLSGCTSLEAEDHRNLDCFEVLAVSPTNRIRHGVELKGILGEEKGFSRLSGPTHFSQSAQIGQGQPSDVDIFLTWYEIAKSKPEPKRELQIRDPFWEKDPVTLTLGQPKYLLSPAQRIATGPPPEVPEWLGLFKAYEITSAGPFAERTVSLRGAMTAEKRNVLKPILLCVPTEESHHEEHIPVPDKTRAFVVYQVDQQKRESQISTIDQFGLNKLSVQSSNWICVPAKFE